MSWEVEYTDEFEEWWLSLTEEEQISVADRLYDEHLDEIKREGLVDG